MFVLHVTQHRMVKQTAHICGSNLQDPSKALHHNQVHFFVAEEIQEGAPCSEEADITECIKESINAVSRLNSLANTPVNIDVLTNELQFYEVEVEVRLLA